MQYGMALNDRAGRSGVQCEKQWSKHGALGGTCLHLATRVTSKMQLFVSPSKRCEI